MAGGWNGSGTYNRYYNWAQDAANAVPIMASRMDTEDSGFAAALSNCITKDGQQTVTANIPFNGFRLTGVGNASASADAMNQATSDARYAPLSTTAPIYKAIKSATTFRSSTTVLANDPHLVVTLPAGSFDVELWIPYYSPVSGGFGVKMQLNFTGTLTLSQFVTYGEGSSTSFMSTVGTIATMVFFSNPVVSASGAGADWVAFRGSIIASVGGDLSLQWCQQVSGAAGVSLSGGATMVVTRIA